MKEYARIKIEAQAPFPEWKIKMLPEKGLILDIGCSSGDLSKSTGAARYRGIDINDEFIKYCKSKGLQVKKGSITKIPSANDLFSGVFCSHVLEHVGMEAQQTAFHEFYRVLKKGGKLILFAPTPFHWYFWDDPTHVRPLTHYALEIMAKNAGFTKVRTFYSSAKWLPARLQNYLRIIPMPFVFWEVGIVAEK